MCISFTGPGTRVVLDQTSSDNRFLKTVIEKLFEGESFQANSTHKRLIIKCPDDFQGEIIDNMQVYFHPLANALINLYNVLREAYRTRSWPDIHDKFISIFAAAEEGLRDLDDAQERAKYREMEQAQRDIRARARLPCSPPAAVLRARAKNAAKEKTAKQAAEKAAKVDDEASRKVSSSKAKRKADSEDDVKSSGAKKSRRITEGA